MKSNKIVLPDKQSDYRELDSERLGPQGPHTSKFSMKTHAGGTTARVHPYSSSRPGPKTSEEQNAHCSSNTVTQKKTSLLGQYKGDQKYQQSAINQSQWYNDIEVQQRGYLLEANDYSEDHDIEESCDENTTNSNRHIPHLKKNAVHQTHRPAPLLKTPILSNYEIESNCEDSSNTTNIENKAPYKNLNKKDSIHHQEVKKTKCCPKHYCKQNKICKTKRVCNHSQNQSQTIVRKIVTIPQIGMHAGVLANQSVLVPHNAIIGHPGLIQTPVYPNQKLYINGQGISDNQQANKCKAHRDNDDEDCREDDSDDSDDHDDCDCCIDGELGEVATTEMGSSKPTVTHSRIGKCDCDQGSVAMPPVGVVLAAAPVLQTQWPQQGQPLWNFIPTQMPIVQNDKVGFLCCFVCVAYVRLLGFYRVEFD